MTAHYLVGVVSMKENLHQAVRIGRFSLSKIQFIGVTAIGVVLASIPNTLARRAFPWPCSSWGEILLSRQLLSTLALGVLFLFVCAGLASYKSLSEMRRIERVACLFGGAYAGASLGPLFNAAGVH